MKIQIWTDFVCPHCYAGKEQLKDAIDTFDSSIELEMMSFELAPGVEDNNNMIMADVLESQFGMSKSDLEKNSKQVQQMVNNAGLEINSDKLKFSNTLKAHTLLQYFKEQGKGFEFAKAVFNAYFTEGAYLNKFETLAEITKDFGIDSNKTKEIIEDETYITKVHEDQNLANEIGVQSVPHVLIDGKLAVTGSYTKETYIDAIKKAQEF